MLNRHVVDLDGGDLGRALYQIPCDRACLEAAMKIGIRELQLASDENLKTPLARDPAWCYPIEIVATDGQDITKPEELQGWLTILFAKLVDGSGVDVFRTEEGGLMFPIYGASGGLAAAKIVYLVRVPRAESRAESMGFTEGWK